MALDANQLTKLDNVKPATALDGKSRQVWWYDSGADTAATVAAAGYFNTVRSLVQVGDMVIVVAPSGIVFMEFATVPETGNITTTQAATAIKSVRGQHTTVAAADTIVTGLATVQGVIASLDDDPVAGVMHVTATIGNQAGAPAAGSVIIKGWKATAAGDTALIAATTFGKKVNYLAWGV